VIKPPPGTASYPGSPSLLVAQVSRQCVWSQFPDLSKGAPSPFEVRVRCRVVLPQVPPGVHAIRATGLWGAAVEVVALEDAQVLPQRSQLV
jgi:hypothetical protein